MQDQNSTFEFSEKLDSYLELNRESWSALSSIDELIKDLHKKTIEN